MHIFISQSIWFGSSLAYDVFAITRFAAFCIIDNVQ